MPERTDPIGLVLEDRQSQVPTIFTVYKCADCFVLFESRMLSRRLITLTTTSTHRNANTISPWRGHYLTSNNTSTF